MATPIDPNEVAERELEARSRYPWRLKACASTACLSAGAGASMAAMERAVEADDLALDVQLICAAGARSCVCSAVAATRRCIRT